MNVLIVTLIVVILDQVTKLYVKGIKIPLLGIDIPGMPYQSSIPVIGNFFQITFIENPGMAFGLQIGGKLFLSLFTIFATLLLLYFLFKNRKEKLLLRLALALILGGAIGNLIDRVFYGKIYEYAPLFYGRVVDFFHFDLPNFTIFGKTIYSWPIFNIADISVTVGFLMILFGYKKIFAQHESNESEVSSMDEADYSDVDENFLPVPEGQIQTSVNSSVLSSGTSEDLSSDIKERYPEDTIKESGRNDKAGQNNRPAEDIE